MIWIHYQNFLEFKQFRDLDQDIHYVVTIFDFSHIYFPYISLSLLQINLCDLDNEYFPDSIESGF